ncbi:unnamed protein product [Ceratitis capitata]|uniref:(Mediterranean fruit fly) hypothetical protein n=1 Tax=Ceratitis capitata TaxID=7213 RepID=A0A811UXX9_CERCA|nr:unnamed protein product [Ceratitis capitata]
MADALSRLKTEVYALTDSVVAQPSLASEGNPMGNPADVAGSETDTATECTMHSAEQDNSDLIPHVEASINPGKINVVADALSRLKTEVYALTDSVVAQPSLASEGNPMGNPADVAGSETDTATECTMHSAEQDNSDLIPHVEASINVFRNQLE